MKHFLSPNHLIPHVFNAELNDDSKYVGRFTVFQFFHKLWWIFYLKFQHPFHGPHLKLQFQVRANSSLTGHAPEIGAIRRRIHIINERNGLLKNSIS